MILILRRRKLGKGSCMAIKENSVNDIVVVRNDKLKRRHLDAELLIRWGCTSEVPIRKVINKAVSIERVNNKPLCREMLIEAGINVPRTYFNQDEIPERYPLLGRRRKHAQGRHIHMINNLEEFRTDNSYYWSEYLRKEKEFRVFTFFGKVLMVAEKIPRNIEDIAWNHHQGSSFRNLRWAQWPKKACLEALKAAKVIGIDFSGVDVIYVREETLKPYVLELNSAHSLTSEYRQKTFAKALDWAIQKARNNELEHFEVPETIETYRDILHPCLVEEHNEG